LNILTSNCNIKNFLGKLLQNSNEQPELLPTGVAANKQQDQLTISNVWIKSLLLLAVDSSTSVGELAARAKTNSPKEQLQKPLQSFDFPGSFQELIWVVNLA
jgi:hypothetical protein